MVAGRNTIGFHVIVAGIRTATTEVIASATLAAFIGIGGLGLFVVRGFALYDISILLVGAIPVALLALFADLSLGGLQKKLQPSKQVVYLLALPEKPFGFNPDFVKLAIKR